MITSDTFTVCLFENGEIYSWGGSQMKRNIQPGIIPGLEKFVIKDIACG